MLNELERFYTLEVLKATNGRVKGAGCTADLLG